MESGNKASHVYGNNRRTIYVVDVVSSWAVNNFYNYLYFRATALHTSNDKIESITDAYMVVMRQYLDSFNNSNGYRINLKTLHEYYIDHTKYVSNTFTEWINEILSQFVPEEYFGIMSTTQQDQTLRGILVGVVRKFGSELVCSNIIDSMIADHKNKYIVPRMKDIMKQLLLVKRQELYRAIYNNTSSSTTDAVRKELKGLIHENVLIKQQKKETMAHLKRAIAAMRTRDIRILELETTISRLSKRPDVMTAPAPAPAPQQLSDVFKSVVESKVGVRIENEPFEQAEEMPNIEDVHEAPNVGVFEDHHEEYHEVYRSEAEMPDIGSVSDPGSAEIAAPQSLLDIVEGNI
jgi:hypothetical protein